MPRSMFRAVLPLVGVALLVVPSAGLAREVRPAAAVVAPKPSGRIDQLAERIDPLVTKHEGDVAVAVVNLDSGESLFRRADEPMPTASLIKLAVLIEAYRQDRAGLISLNYMTEVRAEDEVPGSGVLTPHFSPGTRISLRDAVRLMVVFSDNTATNLILDRVGLQNVNDTTAALGCPDTRIHAKVFRGDTSIAPERSKQFGLGSITARQAVSLLARLHRRELWDVKACDDMLADLLACDDKLKVRRGLPPGAKWAHKTGSVNAVRTDAGLLETPGGTIALCILTNNNKDQSWDDQNDAELLCAEIGRAVYETFSRKADGTLLATPGIPAGPLSVGANGDLVADLQRTLNKVIGPSLGLGVDGDFGPVTKASVERFQREKGLEVTGTVGPETWAALGPLVTQDEPVPDPQEIAKQAAALPVLPPDDPNGPPFVTCKSWAIGDAATGEILWNFNGDEPRHQASTTKIMCALVVLDLVAKDPAVLDEVVTFSKRADDTPGSTADVRAGEKAPVRELLYGLLLPSGNDVATAFAEHFGPRLEPAAEPVPGTDPKEPIERFVAEMNRTAVRLGLKATFRNPHGLSVDGHRSSAADLVRLARAAREHEIFRTVTSTRLHGCTVEGEGGYKRNTRWENTNQLLGTTGYGGVKTGTTDAAGACLVSLGTDPAKASAPSDSDRRLIIAVLGSTSPDARYTDTRNLFRWAWGQLGKGTTVGGQ